MRTPVLVSLTCILCLVALSVPGQGPVRAEGASPNVLPESCVSHLASVPCFDAETGLRFSPLGLAYDVTGALYVVDSDNSKIFVVSDSSGSLGFFAGCPEGLGGCSFIDIATDAGWFYVSERSHGLLVVLDSRGSPRLTTEVGDGIGGIGLGEPGQVYVAMTHAGSIVISDVYGEKSPIVCPISGGGEGSYPIDCLVEKSQRVFVTDANSKKVLILGILGDSRGYLEGFAFKNPFGVTATADGLVLVSDSGLGLVAVFDADGKFRGTFGQGHLKTPAFIAARGDGTVSVADPGKMTVEVFHFEGLGKE